MHRLKTSIQTQSFPSNTGKYEDALAKWLVATTNFYGYYSRINQTLTKEAVHGTHIGQCPVSHLVQLAVNMQEELKKLVKDMSQSTDLTRSTVDKGYVKLLNHSRALEKLNQQARRALELADSSAS